MKKIIIVGIDGTIANCEHRLHYIKEGKKKDWAKFYGAVIKDKPIKDVRIMVDLMALAGYSIVFCTGRSEVCRQDTKIWLDRHFPRMEYKLYMRPAKNYDPDWTVKIQLMWEAEIYPNKVLGIFEDRQQVVDAWRDQGYRCYQVVKGDY